MPALRKDEGRRVASGALDECSALPVAELRNYLRGAWMIARLMIDRRGGEGGSLVGWAVFAERGRGLAYEERGQVLLGSYCGVATRRYLYALSEPGRAEVHFPDGRFFHDLDLTSGAWRATHLCGEDLYAGRFRSRTANEWTCTWRVTGPRKDLMLASRYIRCCPARG